MRRDPGEWPSVSESTTADAGPDERTVLLVLERDVDGTTWAVPGGSREDGETYEAAVRREVSEETGVSVGLDAPYLVSYDRLRSAAGGETVLHTLWVCFDATYESGSVAVQSSELRGAAWFDAPPRALGAWSQYRADDWWDEYDPDERWWEDGGAE